MKKKILLLLMILSLVTLAVACNSDNEANTFEGKNTRMVIGSSSTTGDSYLVAEGARKYLEKELNNNMKVDAVGAGPAFEAISNADPDGSTIMMFHDMTYLGISFGAFDEKYALENMRIGPMMVKNSGSCFAASADEPYDDMVEMADYLVENPNETVRVNIEAGGVSHIGFIAYYDWVVNEYGQDVADRIQVITGGSFAEKSQNLWDGNTDVIFGDYASVAQYTDENVDNQVRMKYIGLLDNLSGIDIPSYEDMGITVDGEPFSFAKEYVIYMPKDTPDELANELEEAAKNVCDNESFIKDMNKYYYEVKYLDSNEAKDYLYDKRDKLDKLIQRAPSMDELTSTN